MNNPNAANGPYIRTLEWKHMMQPEFASRIRGTVLTRELTVTPDNPHDYEYPLPDEAHARLYERYRERTKMIPNLLAYGRLGQYRYYDMDQAIARAMLLAKRILSGQKVMGGD